MDTFKQLADKADRLLESRLKDLDEREADLSKRKAELYATEAEIDNKRVELVEEQKQSQALLEEISIKSTGLKRQEEIERMHADAVSYREQARMLKEKSEDLNNETKQKESELARRELALSEREKVYREEIKQEIINKALGVKL